MTTTTDTDVAVERLSLVTWLRFLLGDRNAILAFARSTDAIWAGLLFVLSAGLAREYDGEYLLYEPWHAVLPLAASLVTSLFLYVLVYWAAFQHGVRSLGWWSGYRTLLTFYWMTAPLAWLYAIPVERFLDPAQATRANFALLAVVSIWRVLLITRAISVWLQASYLRILWIVLFFGLTVLLVADFLTPMPVWDLMGGIRLPERERFIVDIRMSIRIFGTLAWFALTVIAGIAILGRASWSTSAPTPPTRTGISIWLLATVLLYMGFQILPFGQTEQAKRWHAEYLLRSRLVAEGVKFMAATPRGEFPPHWDPPPRTTYGEDEPSVEEVIAELNNIEAPSWLRDLYTEKLLSSYNGLGEAIDAAIEGKPDRLKTMLDLLERSSTQTFGHYQYWQLKEASKNLRLDATLREQILTLMKRYPEFE